MNTARVFVGWIFLGWGAKMFPTRLELELFKAIY
jgi:hypothetical protein